MNLVIANRINSQTAAYRNEGQDMYSVMAEAMNTGQSFNLSFAGLDTCSTQFLNASIGKLYRTFPEAAIAAQMRITDIEESDTILPEMIRRTINKALHPDQYAELMGKTLDYA